MNEKIAFVLVPKTGCVTINGVVQDKCVSIKHEPTTVVTAAMFRAEHPDAFIFAFMRNPYDRLISVYSYLMAPWAHYLDVEDRKRYIEQYADFRDFVIRGVGGGAVMIQRHCRPQVSWITDESGKVVVDFLGKFEALQDDFDRVCDRVGWERTKLQRSNKTDHPPYRQCYDVTMRQIVWEVYAKDFEVGGYDRGL